MITLRELSQKCGVSIATVSNVINGKSNVSQATKDYILSVIQETGYKPNYLASSLRSDRTRSIGLIIEEVCAFSSPRLIDGIMSVLEKNGYRCVLENVRLYSRQIDDSGKEYENAIFSAVRQMLAIKVDGIIVVAAHCRKINCFPPEMEIPAVISYAQSVQNSFPSVMIADEQAGYEMTEYLISAGHKKIAIVLGVKDNLHSVRRLNGYKNALRKNKIEVSEDLIFYGDWSRQSGFEIAPKILEKNVSAVFCLNDFIAAGFCDYLLSVGKKAGKDIAVAGFDNQIFSKFMQPTLTTMEIPLIEIGQKSAELIISLLNGETPAEKEMIVPCKFIKGESA